METMGTIYKCVFHARHCKVLCTLLISSEVSTTNVYTLHVRNVTDVRGGQGARRSLCWLCYREGKHELGMLEAAQHCLPLRSSPPSASCYPNISL